MRTPLRRYRSLVADSERWNGFTFREGDIVISAPIKCGTTWVQMICALIIFKRYKFRTTLDLISPWLDLVLRPLSDVVQDLEFQQHRRFIKTHTPLDGLPFDTRATYICIGRDPRDAAISFDNHMANLDMDSFFALVQGATDPDTFLELAPRTPRMRAASQRERFWEWMAAPVAPGLHALVYHLSTFWEARDCPNVLLLHYDDLKTDLEGQMRRMAGRLGLTVCRELWPELVQAATFEEMRRRADDIVPNASAELWYDNMRFFNQGASGQWRQLLDDEDLRRYEACVKALAKPELIDWIHQGPIC